MFVTVTLPRLFISSLLEVSVNGFWDRTSNSPDWRRKADGHQTEWILDTRRPRSRETKSFHFATLESIVSICVPVAKITVQTCWSIAEVAAVVDSILPGRGWGVGVEGVCVGRGGVGDSRNR